jgi:hypothetical protein
MQGVDRADDRCLAELEASDSDLDPKFIFGVGSKHRRSPRSNPFSTFCSKSDERTEPDSDPWFATSADARFGIRFCDLCRASLQLLDFAGALVNGA